MHKKEHPAKNITNGPSFYAYNDAVYGSRCRLRLPIDLIFTMLRFAVPPRPLYISKKDEIYIFILKFDDFD